MNRRRSPYAPGTVLGVPVHLGAITVEHVGIVTDSVDWFSGECMVISASKKNGAVVEETMSAFAGDGVPTVKALQPRLPVPEVLRRARHRLGERWDLLESNCEHFVYECLGYVKTSPQLVAAGVGVLAVGSVGVGVWWMARRTSGSGS